jgi:5-methylcytosine-specific restriction endonuclease McrA
MVPGARPAPASPEPRLATGRSPADIPVQAGVTLSPLQLAQLEALIESVRKRRLVAPGSSRGEIILAALEALATGARPGAPDGERTVGARQGADGGETAGGDGPANGDRDPGVTAGSASDGSTVVTASPYTVVLYQCLDCQRAEVVTQGGRRPVSAAVAETVLENARIHDAGRNRQALTPARRAAILARDGHRCRAPGCGSVRFLEVHHILPRELGGSNAPANLVTLCGRCHRFIHDRLKRGLPAPVLAPSLAARPDRALHDRREHDQAPEPSPRPP